MDNLTKIGAYHHQEEQFKFCIWAPQASEVKIVITEPEKKIIPLSKTERAYWSANITDIKPGYRYFVQIDGSGHYPDPASLSQPDGVHGASEVVDVNLFHWEDYQWRGTHPNQMIIYELHTGTFSNEGTFDGIIKKLPELAEIGINTIEIMPVSQFPGKRNWGYDGVYPFAVQNSYGGPFALMKLVNECHKQGFSVVLDVVYNHLGPEGNYLENFGPYFTHIYGTPWGKAVNYDDAWSDGVRNYVIQNALMWLRDFHIDGLRLDAIHAIFDFSAKHIMQELTEHVEALNIKTGRNHFLIAESNLNDVKYIKPVKNGGYGLRMQWSDDFHHALHALITGEQNGYYVDYGKMDDLAKAVSNAFVLDGTYSQFRQRTFGNQTTGLHGDKFIIFTQNHDQVGNRKFGERLPALVSYEMLKTAAGAMFTSPYIPMLFMGEEYGEEHPFLYFVDHNDTVLNQQVREGRNAEFKSFHDASAQPAPDPAHEQTFHESMLKWDYKEDPKKKTLRQFYQQLINLRRTHSVLSDLDKDNTEVDAKDNLLIINRGKTKQVRVILNYSKQQQHIHLNISPDQVFYKLMDSADAHWRGPGSESPDEMHVNDSVIVQPESFILYAN
ncbi:MAG: malto-oligosyltrehalose trehalohydrolase [Bacteroidetes bacterium]|jgi:maltooligosyltrehalose trehalohydrolase|nr:malto-oligosyltrehalose trehalohydrolase [Bacteroidota bacterium]